MPHPKLRTDLRDQLRQLRRAERMLFRGTTALEMQEALDCSYRQVRRIVHHINALGGHVITKKRFHGPRIYLADPSRRIFF